jgi:DNA-binding MarR family transcriptional regulator
MKSGTRKTNKGGDPLTAHDIEGAVRVFQSLEKLVGRPRLVESLQPKPTQLLTLAKRIREVREKRKTFLAPELFGEPGWDILLSLYIASREGYRMIVTSVCHESGVPDTTAMRWLDSLREMGLVEKRRNPLDARASFVELKPETVERLDRILELAWQDYFPFD